MPAAADESILRTLLYADVFDYPLSAAEIEHYLLGDPSALGQIGPRLQSSQWLSQRVTRANGYYTARGRAELAALRDQRRSDSQRLWARARVWGLRLGALPFVRMVAVTGALAVNNARTGDDIDFLVVTAPGRVWLTRALCIALVRLARLFRVGLCPNYVLARSAIAQEQRNLYVAHDLLQMVPLAGFTVYEEMRAANRWAEDLLTRARRPLHHEPELRPSPLLGLLQRLGEWLLRGWLGDRLEAWERRRKQRKFAPAAQIPGSTALLDSDHVKGHFHDHGRAVLRAYEERLARYLA